MARFIRRVDADREALATCSAADATVLDEGRTFEGLATIKAWRVGATRKYAYTVEPLGGIGGCRRSTSLAPRASQGALHAYSTQVGD